MQFHIQSKNEIQIRLTSDDKWENVSERFNTIGTLNDDF